VISSAEALGLIEAIDRLYAAVVDAPDAWDDAALAAWIEDMAAARDEPIDRAAARLLRRALRLARRLGRYWEGRPGRPDDWRSAVDEALGSPGWGPGLDLARRALEDDPTEELFEQVQERFRVVYFRPWLEGVDFATWTADRRADVDGTTTP
jgi:hypothetical protein